LPESKALENPSAETLEMEAVENENAKVDIAAFMEPPAEQETQTQAVMESAAEMETEETDSVVKTKVKDLSSHPVTESDTKLPEPIVEPSNRQDLQSVVDTNAPVVNQGPKEEASQVPVSDPVSAVQGETEVAAKAVDTEEAPLQRRAPSKESILSLTRKLSLLRKHHREGAQLEGARTTVLWRSFKGLSRRL